MINFYSFYNKTGLDKEEYSILIDQLLDEKYTKEMKIIEHIIKKNPKNAYWYAKRCLKSRWIEAEPIIMKDSYYAYLYAEDIIKGRWPEAEPVIMTRMLWAYRYSINIIKGRWKEAEPIMMLDPYVWPDYCRKFGL